MTHTPGDIALTIVIPAFNEADNLTPVIQETLDTLKQQPWIDSFEIIVVDDGSTDGTRAVADRLAAEHASVIVLHHPSNCRLGAALMSADGEVGPDQVVLMLRDVGRHQVPAAAQRTSKVANLPTMLKTFWEMFLLRLSIRRGDRRFAGPVNT